MNEKYIESLDYTGSVCIKEFNGKELVRTTKFHNHGCLPLFRFFAKCLGGDYMSANLLRPSKIKLFDCLNRKFDPTSVDYMSPESFDFESASLSEVSTDFIYIDTNLKVSDDKATFRFSIPYAYLLGSWLSVIALYADSERQDTNPSAYYLLTKTTTDQDSKTISWDPIDIKDKNHNYSLLIEWTMKISNPTDTNSTNESNAATAE